MKIISRSEWGAKPWRRARPRVPITAREFFVLHYHGGPVTHQVGTAVPRNVEVIHLNNGWSGTGYSFMIDQDGTIYEGAGWNLQGAHSPKHNYDGLGVYFAVGGNQQPSAAAKRAAADLYTEACKRTGRKLRIWWHGRDYPTACPGPHLIAWCKAGMPRPGGGSSTPTNDTDWITRMFKNISEFKKAVINAAWGDRFPNPNPNKNSVKKNPHISGYTYLAWIYNNARQANENSAAALAIAKAGAKQTGITDADLAKVEKAAREGAHAGVDDKIGDADVTLEVKE